MTKFLVAILFFRYQPRPTTTTFCPPTYRPPPSLNSCFSMSMLNTYDITPDPPVTPSTSNQQAGPVYYRCVFKLF